MSHFFVLMLGNVSTNEYKYPNILVHYSCRGLWLPSPLEQYMCSDTSNMNDSGNNVYVHLTVCFAAPFLKAFIVVIVKISKEFRINTKFVQIFVCKE
jgi:hypothetical protein